MIPGKGAASIDTGSTFTGVDRQAAGNLYHLYKPGEAGVFAGSEAAR
jgi:hypothetical protein